MNRIDARLDEGETLVMDGALGTELIRHGIDIPLPLWSSAANTNAPQAVEKIHRDYLAAGADIITANTFRSTTRTYLKAEYAPITARQLARKSLINAVTAARNAAGPEGIVAGSMAPLEDCYSPGLFPGQDVAIVEYRELAGDLAAAGVDLLLLETMGVVDEAEAALAAAAETGLPTWVSFMLADGDSLLGGALLDEALAMVRNYDVSVVLLNCANLDVTAVGVGSLMENWYGRWGVYPNLGLGEPSVDGKISRFASDEKFKSAVADYIQRGAQVIGSCCGSNPSHTRLIKEITGDLEQSLW